MFCVPTDAVELAGQFDTTPPPAELRREETLTPVSNPFDWLVSHTHVNPVVNRYADSTLRKIHLALSSEYAKEIRAELNSFLYRALTSGDPLLVLCDKACVSLLLLVNDYYPIAPFYFGQTVAAEYDEETMKSVTVLPYVAKEDNTTYHGFGSYRLKPIIQEWISQPSFQLSRKTIEPDETMAAAIAALIRAADEVSFTRAASSFQTLARAKLTARLQTYLTRYQAFYEKKLRPYLHTYDLHPFAPGNFIIQHGHSFKDRHFFTPEEEAKRCSQLPERIIADERQTFETFIKEFRDFILALAKEPITAGSGIYEMKPVGQMTSDKMRNRIANQLVDLPDYIAKVKIKGEPEHLIQTLDPKKQADKPLYGQLLEDRVEKIKLYTRTAGYTRPRQDVEVEIRMRQDALRQAAQPQVREVPQPQGRLLPICKNCGSQNQPGANFCNKCGEKLYP